MAGFILVPINNPWKARLACPNRIGPNVSTSLATSLADERRLYLGQPISSAH
jgi:hypothetical protein